MDARDSRRSQHLRKAAFARRRSKRNAVQQNLSARSTQQHAAAAAGIQGAAQLFPGRFKLLRSLHVSKLVKTREFQQNVQAAHKRARASAL